MAEQYPRKLPAKQLAILFGVSEQRISQLKRKGKLNPDSANLYDVQEAKQLRGFQMSEHGVRVVAQTYGNGTGKIAPPKVTPMNADVVLSPEDREALGIEPNEQIAPSPNSHFVAASRITELREQKIKAEIERIETRAKRERGELVERAKVQSSFIEAGARIAAILQNLPAEIASIFADPDKKAKVRLKVQTRVDQAQHTLYTSMRDYGEDDAG